MNFRQVESELSEVGIPFTEREMLTLICVMLYNFSSHVMGLYPLELFYFVTSLKTHASRCALKGQKVFLTDQNAISLLIKKKKKHVIK